MLLSLAIRHYNNAAFVEAALAGAFAQTYDPLEIVFLDDCSTDGGFERAKRMIDAYRGPHRVKLLRNERNLGVGGQYARLASAAAGEIVVIADADDVSLPQRCQRIYEAFRDGGPDLLGVTSYFDPIDEAGKVIESLSAELTGGRLLAEEWSAETMARGAAGPHGAALAFRRGILNLGLPLDPLRRSEDLVCGFRCAALGRLATVREVLVHRRVHLDNVSGPIRASWTGRDLQAWFRRHVRDGVAVPSIMCRDVAGYERARLIAPERAASLRKQALLHLREVKILRVALSRGGLPAWHAYFRLRRLGMVRRASIKLTLQAAAPALAMVFLRRNLIVARRAAAGAQGVQ
jgi:glycosyltransferase involved in cell wall biosynthesis